MTYDHGCQGRIVTNEEGETSLKGLYAIGDEAAPGVSNASVFGWLCGENAVDYLKHADRPDLDNMKEQVEEKVNLIESLSGRNQGADWREVNVAVQQIMQDYAGLVRSEAMLQAGAFHLARLKKKADEIMMAANRHEVSRCFEVLNLMEMGKLIFTAALARQETRGNHVRTDYPLTNPRLNGKIQILKKVNHEMVNEWRTASK